MTLYRVDPNRLNDMPKWAKGIASFNKNHHSLSETPKNVMIKEKVQCLSLNELLKNYKVSKIDLLQIDTEGYDSEIVLNIDFNVIKPSIIHFEHDIPHKVMSKEKFLTIIDFLHNNGHEIWLEDYDVTAYQRNILIDTQ